MFPFCGCQLNGKLFWFLLLPGEIYADGIDLQHGLHLYPRSSLTMFDDQHNNEQHTHRRVAPGNLPIVALKYSSLEDSVLSTSWGGVIHVMALTSAPNAHQARTCASRRPSARRTAASSSRATRAARRSPKPHISSHFFKVSIVANKAHPKTQSTSIITLTL